MNVVDFTRFRSVVESRANRVNIAGAYGCKTVTFSRVDHVWQLHQGIVPKLISVVATLRTVFGSTSNENLAIICLDATESNWDCEVLQQLFSGFAIAVHIVVSNYFLVKLEKVDFVVLKLVLLNFLYEILICGPHFRPIDRSCIRPLLINAYKLGLRLSLVTALSLEAM